MSRVDELVAKLHEHYQAQQDQISDICELLNELLEVFKEGTNDEQ